MNIKRTSIVLLFSILLPFFFQPQSVSAFNGFLRQPFSGLERINAIFDHQYPNYNDYAHEITIFNGETTADLSPYYYAGHSGTDFNLNTGTEVLAAYEGNVTEIYTDWAQNPVSGCVNFVRIQHPNGYKTQYCHLRDVDGSIGAGVSVSAGRLIGHSGISGTTGPHLHFEVFLGPLFNVYYSTDPFGWTGSYPDPLINWPTTGQGHQAQCLWRSLPQDTLSCNDTWLQDAGAGFTTNHGTYSAEWGGYVYGNGSHVTTHINIDDYLTYITWNPQYFRTGAYEIFVFQPVVSDATASAHYLVCPDYNVSCTEVVLDQRVAYPEKWVSLGTYHFSGQWGFITLLAGTHESPYTKVVVADDIKFRSYGTFLPCVTK